MQLGRRFPVIIFPPELRNRLSHEQYIGLKQAQSSSQLKKKGEVAREGLDLQVKTEVLPRFNSKEVE